MTSSLVGSEMCIRDREDPLVRFDAAPSLGLSDRGELRKHKKQIPSLELPVSYTHLTLPTICSV
eukprot:3430576-Prorocentrum_lima.AAC.1